MIGLMVNKLQQGLTEGGVPSEQVWLSPEAGIPLWMGGGEEGFLSDLLDGDPPLQLVEWRTDMEENFTFP